MRNVSGGYSVGFSVEDKVLEVIGRKSVGGLCWIKCGRSVEDKVWEVIGR